MKTEDTTLSPAFLKVKWKEKSKSIPVTGR
jgi:hypothetical protein